MDLIDAEDDVKQTKVYGTRRIDPTAPKWHNEAGLRTGKRMNVSLTRLPQSNSCH